MGRLSKSFPVEGAGSPRALSLTRLRRRSVPAGGGAARSRDPSSWRRRRQQRYWRRSAAGAGSCSRGVGPRQSFPSSAPSLVFRSVAGGAGMAERGLEPAPAAVAALPPEVRAQLAELELELSEGRSRAGVRAAGRRCDRGERETRSPPRALVAVRARGGGCRKSGPEGLGRVVFPLLPPVKWVVHVVHLFSGRG